MMKRWIKNYLLLSLTVVGVVTSFNFLMDPFQQYRKASFYPVVYAKSRFLNPGIAKNYDYSNIVIGSSMTKNFILKNVSEYIQIEKPIKLCLDAGTGYEYYLTLNSALRHKKIDNIIYGLDVFSYSGEIKRFTFEKETFPFYLYNENIFDDYLYLVNIDTFKEIISNYMKTLLYSSDQPPLDFNRMYEWQYLFNHKFDKVDWLDEWNNRSKNFNKDFLIENYQALKFIASFNNNLLPFIKKYTKTKFIIFYPPYSILAYKDIEDKGWLDEYIRFKRYISSLSDQYPNLEIYDFQVAEAVTFNLDNYKDLTHYHQRINRWILEQIKDNNYRVSSSNIDEFNDLFYSQIKKYDIDNIKDIK